MATTRDPWDEWIFKCFTDAYKEPLNFSTNKTFQHRVTVAIVRCRSCFLLKLVVECFINERGEPNVIYRLTGWVREIAGRSSRDKGNNYPRFRGIHGIYLHLITTKISQHVTVGLDLETLRTWPIMPQNLPGHSCLVSSFASIKTVYGNQHAKTWPLTRESSPCQCQSLVESSLVVLLVRRNPTTTLCVWNNWPTSLENCFTSLKICHIGG